MASHTEERGGHGTTKTADQGKNAGAATGKSAGTPLDQTKGRAADVLDAAADTVGESGKKAPEPGKRYARAANERLHDTADYIRDTDPAQMGRDAMHAARAYPVVTLLALSAVVIGGSMVVAAMLKDTDSAHRAEGAGRRPRGLASVASGLGPEGVQTLTRVRDAAVKFVLTKAVDTVDEMFPGFRTHYDERG